MRFLSIYKFFKELYRIHNFTYNNQKVCIFATTKMFCYE